MKHVVGSAILISSVALSMTAAKPRSEPITPIEAAKVTNPAKVSLGTMLYFEPRLSKSGSISCNSCHNLMTSGADNLPSSIGHGWQLGPINSPTVFNSKYNLAQFWDGRAKDLSEQAGGPIANPREMGSTHELATDTLQSIPEYRALFKKVYGTDKLNIANVQDAIAAFEETLVTPNSRFDQWLKGSDKALTATELRGYETFKNKGCVACHSGPGVGGGMYQKFGLVKPYAGNDRPGAPIGRFAVTKNETDKFVFKVPLLRNIELTAPYFHDGSHWTLEETVKTMANVQLGQTLTDAEAGDIVAFLKTLTGERPKISLPLLPPSTNTTPHPDLSVAPKAATDG